MARHLRVEYPGAIYHVTCRMVGDWRAEKSLLFRDDADRERFIEQLSERVEAFHIRFYMFVCMTNHFHLVFETPEANCSRFMQSLATAYTVYYNLRHGRHGHLLDGRFKARLVDGDDYLLALSRYVHLNPVQVGALKDQPLEARIKALRAYPWSSYPGYIGARRAWSFVEQGPLLSEMSGREREWPREYRAYVESGLAESDDDFKVVLALSPRSIGGEGFRAWVDELHQKLFEKHARPEDVAFRRVSQPLPAATVLAILAEVFGVDGSEFCRRRHGSALRAVASRYLMRYAGQSQREVAEELQMGTGAAVCNQLRSLAGKLAKDRRLRRQVGQAEERLDAERLKQRASSSTILAPKQPPAPPTAHARG